MFADDLSELLQFRLLSAVQRQEDLSRFLDFSSDLAARLTRQVLHFAPFSEQILQLKTKGILTPESAGALLHLLLDITKEQSSQAKGLGYAPYARILGFKKSAVRCLPSAQTEPHPTDRKNGRCQKTAFPGSLEGSGNRFLRIPCLSVTSGIPRKAYTQ
ncbi:MAG: nucleotidyltransferase family protein [Clostridium sp.]